MHEAEHRKDWLLCKHILRFFRGTGVLLNCVCLVDDKNENTNIRIFSKRACREINIDISQVSCLQIPYGKPHHIHVIHLSVRKMTHPIYLVSPLNTSPNSVSDLGEKSVNPMKREWYIQIHILIHIAHIVHLNESEWSSIRWIQRRQLFYPYPKISVHAYYNLSRFRILLAS